MPFEDGIAETVAWYRDNRGWWEPIKSGEYREYYESQYAARASPAPSVVLAAPLALSFRSLLISFRSPWICSDRSSSSTTPSHWPSARAGKARL